MLWESQSDCVSDLYTITGAERCGSAPYYQEELEMTQELQKGRKHRMIRHSSSRLIRGISIDKAMKAQKGT